MVTMFKNPSWGAPTYDPSCTAIVLAVMPDGRSISPDEVLVCLGDCQNREGRPVTRSRVVAALRALANKGIATRVGRDRWQRLEDNNAKTNAKLFGLLS